MSVKYLAQVTSNILVLPFRILIVIFGSGPISETLFVGTTQLFSLIPFKVGEYIRAAFMSQICDRVDQNIVVGFLTVFSHRDIDIGEHAYIGPQSNIGSCSIESNCLLGSGVHVLSGKNQHYLLNTEIPIRNQGGEFIKIVIGSNSWIGNSAVVMANIGRNCVVAAGSVVVHDVPDNSIIGGNPAKQLMMRDAT